MDGEHRTRCEVADDHNELNRPAIITMSGPISFVGSKRGDYRITTEIPRFAATK